jgi:hypothetical protein
MIKTGKPKHKALTRRGQRSAIARACIERQGNAKCAANAGPRLTPLLATLLTALLRAQAAVAESN